MRRLNFYRFQIRKLVFSGLELSWESGSDGYYLHLLAPGRRIHIGQSKS